MADVVSEPPAAPGAAAAPAVVNALQPRPPAKYQLLPPRLLPCGIQFSVHEAPRAFGRELELVLPGVPLEGLLVVPTCQKAACDLLETGPVVAAEKDALLEKFMAWAAAVCDELAAAGHWGDYVDPCSGYAVRTPHSRVVYPEVDACETLLRYRGHDAGGCKVLAHPAWGTAVYPATLFARAPVEVLVAVIERAGSGATTAAGAATPAHTASLFAGGGGGDH